MRRAQQAVARLGIDPFAALGLAAMVAVAAVIAASYTGVFRAIFSGEGPRVSAVFANTATLRKGDPVRVRGVKVGTVKELQAVDGARATKVTMTLDRDAGPLYADARAKVAWRSLLGGAFAVNVDPGRAESGRLHGSIPLGHTTSQVELDDITSVVEGDARTGLRTIPPQLSRTMRDPATLQRLADGLAHAAPSIRRGLNAARGTRKEQDLRTLLRNTNTAVRALDTPDDALRAVVSGAGATLQVTAAREADLRSTLASAPGVLRNTDATLTALDTTLGVADPVLTELRGPAWAVAPALTGLRPVVTGADRLLTRARPLLRDLRPAVSSLAATARGGVPLVDAVSPSLSRLDRTILPYLNEKDPDTGFTTAEMVGPGAGGLANVAAQWDQNGHVLRFPFSSGSSPFYLPCQVYAGNPDKAKLVECRKFQDIVTSYLNYNPLKPTPSIVPPPPTGGASTRGK